MLKNRKLKQYEFVTRDIKTGKIIKEGGDIIYGYCQVDGFFDELYAPIKQENIIKEIDNEEYYIAEVKTNVYDTDYHTYGCLQEFEGIYMAFNLKKINTILYFNEDLTDELLSKTEIINLIKEVLYKKEIIKENDKCLIDVTDKGYLRISIQGRKINENLINCSEMILKEIRNYYSKKNIHITRIFGSYILLKNENGKLKAIKATPIPIKYCPLMIKLLKEVGGNVANNLLTSLENSDLKNQEKLMCELINEVVIASGYFDTNRPLNSCEANVLFGASEIMYSAFESNLIDAAVIVSNNLGTIITTNALSTQGAVKRMTGLFYTSPNSNIVNNAISEGIIPVFPYTAEIDQLEGVKKAIELGYKKIAVSVAASDNILHKKLSELEKANKVDIYKFGLCSTGIDKKTAEYMRDYADVIWSCASKEVKECIEPNAVAQVGIKIPVHIMTKKGWEIVKNHLEYMNGIIEDIKLQKGENKRILLHSNEKIKVLTKRELDKCNDCPYPCI